MPDATLVSAATIAWLGLAIGLALGMVGARSGFCAMGAVADIVTFGSWQRMRMWALAAATAIFGTLALRLAGMLDPADTIQGGTQLRWLSHLVGGLCFGIGMTLASGCANKTLLRLGGGNLKALVVLLVMAVSASMTLRGLFATWRVRWLDPVAIPLGDMPDLPGLLAALAGIDAHFALIGTTLLVGGALAVFALAGRETRSADLLLGGLGVGALVVAGWVTTAWLGFVPEHPDTLEPAFIGTNSGRAESLSFVAPVAYTLELLMLWSDRARIVTFGIASAVGVALGAALHARFSGSFRIEAFRDADDLLRHIAGAVLMGFGGVTALGCTIGQGVTGLSTLTFGAFITAAAIIAGSALTLKLQLWLMMRDSGGA